MGGFLVRKGGKRLGGGGILLRLSWAKDVIGRTECKVGSDVPTGENRGAE